MIRNSILNTIAAGLFVLLSFAYNFAATPALAGPADNIARAVVRLKGNDRSGGQVFATGFLVQADSSRNSGFLWLLTARHILDSCTDSLTIGFRRLNNGVFQANPIKLKIRENGKPVYFSHEEYDVAAMKVSVSADLDNCLFSSDFIADDRMLEKSGFGMGSSLLVVGFPYGEACNDAGFAFARVAAVSSFPVLPSSLYSVFHADFEVFAGYSGAPVILNDDTGKQCLAGMVLEEVFLEEFEPIRKNKALRTRRGLGIARVLNAALIKKFLASIRH